MKKQICICDHCGAEFNPIIGYSDMEIDDFDFIKMVDLCTDCHQELCENYGKKSKKRDISY